MAVVFAVACCWHSAQGQDPQPPGLQVVGGDFSLRRVLAEPEPKSQDVLMQFKEQDSEACVLLKNDNVLFGQARQLGEFVIVKTGAGGEVRLARLDVACWAESIRDLYQFRVDQRGEPNLSIHLRDARWCIRHDLYDLAAKELLAVRRLDPENREADLMENQLRRLVAPSKPAASGTVVTKSYGYSDPIHSSSVVAPAVHQAAEQDHVDFDSLTVRRFASHIQPMLVNRCGVCHQPMAPSRQDNLPSVEWKLNVPAAGSRASASMTRANLQAITPYIDALSPEKSPLLIKATTVHGDDAVVLSQRNSKAIQVLEQWINMAALSLSRDQAQSGQATDHAKPVSLVDRTQKVSGVPESEERSDWQADSDANQDVVPSPAVEPRGTKATPHRLPQVSNPFDPDLFNRRFHASKSN